jgi:hypothetical protein
MARRKYTHEELQKVSEHLYYEIGMFQMMSKGIGSILKSV